MAGHNFEVLPYSKATLKSSAWGSSFALAGTFIKICLFQLPGLKLQLKPENQVVCFPPFAQPSKANILPAMSVFVRFVCFAFTTTKSITWSSEDLCN